MTENFNIDAVRTYLVGLQNRITSSLNIIDATPFVVDAWHKEAHEPLQGQGVTMIMEGGPVFERAGCGFRMSADPNCPPRPRHIAPNWPALLLRPWVFPWYFIRVTRMCPRCI